MTYPQQQQYPYQYGQQQQFNQFRQLKIIPVTNRAEANSTQVDYSGVPTFFYNQTTGEIYKKQFDINTGLATFQDYKRTEPSDEPITKEITYLDMETYQENYNALMSKLDGLYSIVKDKGVKNAK